MSFGDEISRISSQHYAYFRYSRKGAGGGSWLKSEAKGDGRLGSFQG
jgi:hypothetical protein